MVLSSLFGSSPSPCLTIFIHTIVIDDEQYLGHHGRHLRSHFDHHSLHWKTVLSSSHVRGHSSSSSLPSLAKLSIIIPRAHSIIINIIYKRSILLSRSNAIISTSSHRLHHLQPFTNLIIIIIISSTISPSFRIITPLYGSTLSIILLMTIFIFILIIIFLYRSTELSALVVIKLLAAPFHDDVHRLSNLSLLDRDILFRYFRNRCLSCGLEHNLIGLHQFRSWDDKLTFSFLREFTGLQSPGIQRSAQVHRVRYSLFRYSISISSLRSVLFPSFAIISSTYFPLT